MYAMAGRVEIKPAMKTRLRRWRANTAQPLLAECPATRRPTGLALLTTEHADPTLDLAVRDRAGRASG